MNLRASLFKRARPPATRVKIARCLGCKRSNTTVVFAEGCRIGYCGCGLGYERPGYRPVTGWRRLRAWPSAALATLRIQIAVWR